MGLSQETAPQFGDFCELKEKFAQIFVQKTQEEWCNIFDNTDACVAPILELNEAPKHPHNITQKTFMKSKDGDYVPNPSPVLSRTPGISRAVERAPQFGEHTRIILAELGYTSETIRNLEIQGIIRSSVSSKL